MMSQLGFWRHVPGFRAACRLRLRKASREQETRVFDLSFPTPVGLAPGFDRNGLWINDLLTLGYGFLTVDTGDISPSVLSARLSKRRPDAPVFAQIQTSGPSEESIFQHVVRTFSLLYDFTDAFVISTSGPRSGIASMDDIGDLSNILDELLSIRLSYEQYRPILIRLGRHFVGDDLNATADYCSLSGIDGLILPDPSQIQAVAERTHGRLSMIGSVPESSPDTAVEMLRLGASLLEIGDGYTGSRVRTPRPMLKWLKQ